MVIESWFPVGYELPGSMRVGKPLYSGTDWQIVTTDGDGRCLIAKEVLGARWVDANVLTALSLGSFSYGAGHYAIVATQPGSILAPVNDCRSPNSKSEAMGFARALRRTREVDGQVPLQDAIYVQFLGVLLPTYGISSRVDDDMLLGYWLTGGLRVSAKSTRQLGLVLSWLPKGDLHDVVSASGVLPEDEENAHITLATEEADAWGNESGIRGTAAGGRGFDAGEPFRLAGRSELEQFFNEHVVDVVRNAPRYAVLGVGFPSGVVLHGPPGCGKTFAVEELVSFLGWPSFQIDASSVASPYIHQTSKKVAEVFASAMESAPSVLVIDEMEAFLTDREAGSGSSTHRVEEVAEFLRRIPEATKNQVLVIGMTNRIEMIDSAILRRGRFDHVLKVDPAGEDEVKALLNKLLGDLPCADDVDTLVLAKKLSGRPLSDVTFVIREGARLCARAGLAKIEQPRLLDALDSAPSRSQQPVERRIGFV